jgi:hypothetical protein
VDWLVEADVSEKRAVSIFRAEAMVIINSALKIDTARFSETSATTNQPTGRFKPNRTSSEFSPLVKILKFHTVNQFCSQVLDIRVAVYSAQNCVVLMNRLGTLV